jgi:prolyl-tRNA editing enzyme YbaK/EbsC (Cys-tRNA(Pro) deacylase)
VLVIAAGDRRVDEGRVAELLGEPIERASPPFVREHTGFAIGGVPPLAHAQPLPTFIDASLRRFDVVWAAGGTPHCVFPIGRPSWYPVCG